MDSIPRADSRTNQIDFHDVAPTVDCSSYSVDDLIRDMLDTRIDWTDGEDADVVAVYFVESGPDMQPVTREEICEWHVYSASPCLCDRNDVGKVQSTHEVGLQQHHGHISLGSQSVALHKPFVPEGKECLSNGCRDCSVAVAEEVAQIAGGPQHSCNPGPGGRGERHAFRVQNCLRLLTS